MPDGVPSAGSRQDRITTRAMSISHFVTGELVWVLSGRAGQGIDTFSGDANAKYRRE
jgi:hypothetical protein